MRTERKVYDMVSKQTTATERYRRKHGIKQVVIRFYPSESDLYAHLNAQHVRAGYIKHLIREDMERKSRSNDDGKE